MTVEAGATGVDSVRSHYRDRARRARLVGVAAVVVLPALPWLLDSYVIATGSRVLVFGVLAMSVVVLTGLAGLPTLGQAAYFGFGAYAAAMLARGGVVVGPAQIPMAAAGAALLAVGIGSILVRARGLTFLMLTLAVGELLHTLAGRWSQVTGGTDGLHDNPDVQPFWGMSPLELDGLVFYYVLVVFLLVLLVVHAVDGSPYGAALRGIRDNEARMRSMGYPVERYLLGAYAMSAGLAGAAGAMWFGLRGYVSPDDLGLDVSAMALLAAVMGGVTSPWGACIGAGLVVFTRDYLGNLLAGRGSLLLGVLFILVVYLLPGGLAGIRCRRWPFRVVAGPSGHRRDGSRRRGGSAPLSRAAATVRDADGRTDPVDEHRP